MVHSSMRVWFTQHMNSTATTATPTTGRKVRRGPIAGVLTSVIRCEGGWACMLAPDDGGHTGFWLGDEGGWSLLD